MTDSSENGPLPFMGGDAGPYVISGDEVLFGLYVWPGGEVDMHSNVSKADMARMLQEIADKIDPEVRP